MPRVVIRRRWQGETLYYVRDRTIGFLEGDLDVDFATNIERTLRVDGETLNGG